MNRWTFAAAVGIALLVGVPFLDKAYHIDDTFVLTVSRQILREPLRPFNATIIWGRGETPIFERTKNPALLSYYLAPFIRFCGYSEVVLHGAMLVFLVMLAVGTALLGRWAKAGAWWPMLFVMLSPAVVASSNVMRDVPAAGLLTLGLALFVVGTDEDRRGLAAWGAVLVGLAALTKYSSAALIPLLVLYPLLRRKWRSTLWALVPVAMVGLWCVQNWSSQGLPHIVRLMQQRAARAQGFGRPWQEKLYAGLTIAGASLFLLPAVVLAWARRRAWLALPLIIAVGAATGYGVNAHFGKAGLASRPDVVVQTSGRAVAGAIVEQTDEKVTMRIRDTRAIRVPRGKVVEMSREEGRVVRKGGRTFVGKIVAETDEVVVVQMGGWRQISLPRAEVARAETLSWQYYLWATTGAAVLAVALLGGIAAALAAWRSKDAGAAEWVLLVAWAAGAAAFSVLLAPFQATRHFLPVVAPLAILVVRLLGPRREPVAGALGAMLAVQAVVAFVVAFADCEFADAHRQFASEAARDCQAQGGDLWFNGHWGWQHYAEQVHGFQHYWHHRRTGVTPPDGAVILDPKLVHRSRYPAALKKRLVLDESATRLFAARMPARTMGQTYSSFYAVTEHRLPYYLTFDDTPVEIGRVYRVMPEGKH